jgi:hypothetical protein
MYHIIYKISFNPYDNHTHRHIAIPKTTTKPLLGMEIEMCAERNIPKLINCKKGTPAMKITRWRSKLKNTYITTVNDIEISNVEDIKQHIKKCIDMKESAVKIGFSTIEKQALQPQYGILQLYHDQMNIIGKY